MQIATQCQPDSTGPASLSAHQLHSDQDPFRQSVICAHTARNTLYADGQSRVEEWDKTYGEEKGIKKKKLTWGQGIDKVFYSDSDVGFSQIYFSPLNDTTNLEKSKYFMLTALA